MPSYLAVYEDTAPFFTYTGAWRAGSTEDRQAERYSESTFTVTEALGAAMTFQFFGTEVTLLGSKRPNHGLYQVSLDGVASPQISSAGPDEFLVTLYTAKTGKGMHNVTLTNREAKFLDVDQVSWLASVGQDNEPLIVNTRQNSHPAFVYSPPNAWTSAPPAVGTFSGGSGHGTSLAGATATLTFQGDAVALYGPAGPGGASSYSVQVDSRSPSTHSALKQFYRPKQLLYYGGNLGAGTHTLTIKLEATSDRTQVLAIDYAEIYTTPSLGGSFDAAPSPPTGLIVGLAICGVIALICLGLLTYIYVLYKKKRFNFAPAKKTEVDLLADGYMGPGYQTTPLPYPQSSSTGYSSSNDPSTYSALVPPPVPTAYQYQPTASESASLAYTGYQRSVEGGGVATDGRSMISSTAASTSTNPSRGAVFPSRSIRKQRLNTDTEDDTPPQPSAVPPPAYNTGT